MKTSDLVRFNVLNIKNIHGDTGRTGHFVLLVVNDNSPQFKYTYYDSYGNPPHKRLLKILGVKNIKFYNKRDQYKNSDSCGYYAYNYALNILNELL